MDLHLDGPLVSVLMPVYNGGKYLNHAINSILNQTYSNFEFIIINDGSTDDTHSIVSSYNDKRINYITNNENLRLVKSLNIGILLARGKYIARMDSDDISFPKRIEKQVKYLESNKNCGVLGTVARIIDNSGAKGDYIHRTADNSLIKWRFLFTCEFTHPSVMMRRELLDRSGLYRFYEAEDLDLWERMLHITDFANLKECLLYYRKHPSERVKQSDLLVNSDVFKILKRYREYILKHDLTDQNSALIDAFFGLKKFNSLVELKDAVELSTELFKAYTAKEGNNEIKNDFAHTLLYCAERNKYLGKEYCNEIVIRSFKLFPLLFSRGYPFLKSIRYLLK